MKKRVFSLALGLCTLFAALAGTVRGADAASPCARDETCPIHAFTDADAAAQYHDGVHYCLENGLMGGCGNGIFAPEERLSRAMLAQILYNLAGRPAVRAGADGGAWYAGAMAWAASGGIVESDGRAPGEPVEREELALALWRCAKAEGRDVSVGEDTNILSYKDFTLISEDAIPAMQWAAGSGVMKGTADGHLYPLSLVSRAEAASVMRRFLEG